MQKAQNAVLQSSIAHKTVLTRAQAYLLQAAPRGGLRRALSIVLPCTVLVVGLWTIYFLGAVTSFPYPIEYREGASLVLTNFLLQGKNPFSLESQPLGMNNYGIVYNVAALPIAAVFGNTFPVHRMLTALFIGLCALLVFRSARAARGEMSLAFLAAELTAVALAARAGLGAFPSAMGTFFFLAALLIPFDRRFDRRGLALSALLCLLAFYTKPYFVLAVVVVSSYLFFCVSRIRALGYILLFSALFAVSFFLIRAWFPLYFFDTVVSNRLQAVALDQIHLGGQLAELLREFFPSMVAGLLVVLAAHAVQSEFGAFRKPLLHPNLADFGLPMLSIRLDFLAYAACCSAVAFVLVLGPNPGGYLTYAFQLVLPPFFLWLVRGLKPWSRLTILALPLLLLNLAYFSYNWLNPSFLSQLSRSKDVWSRLYAVADSSDRILNSPILAADMIGRGHWPVDSGQTEYYFGMGDYPWSGLVGPDQAAINADGRAYLADIRAAVGNRQFDRLIVTDEPRPPLFRYGLLQKSYHRTETFTIPMPLVPERWDIVVWEPDPE